MKAPLSKVRHRSAPWMRTLRAAFRLQWNAAPRATGALLALTLFAAPLPALAALLTRRLIDALVAEPRPTGHLVTELAIAVAAASALTAVLLSLATYQVAVARNALTLRVTDQLFARLGRFRGLEPFEDPSFHNRLTLGEQAAQQGPQMLISFVIAVGRGIVMSGSFLVTLLAIWPPMALFVIVAVVPMLVIRAMQGRHGAEVLVGLAENFRHAFSHRLLFTDVRSVKEMQLYGFADFVHKRFVERSRLITESLIRIERRGALAQVALALLSGGAITVGLVVVARGVAAGGHNVGDVALFLAAVVGIQGAFASIVGQVGPVRQALSLFENYILVIEAKEPILDGVRRARPLRSTVAIEDVWFRYSPNAPFVLRGLNVVIPAGATVGLVGENGAGKSTLVKLLCRFYDPTTGTIRWDGDDIRTFEIGSYRGRISGTFQDFATYDFSAGENIGVGAISHRERPQRIAASAVLAGIHETLSKLPQGYDTLLSRVFTGGLASSGTTLSGGEWQRIALARGAMLDSPDLLMLDEPSAGLDAGAEEHLYRTLLELRRDRTTVVISHRMGVMRQMDMIIVLSGGKVREQGTHSELMALAGEYARLFRAQARSYREDAAAASI